MHTWIRRRLALALPLLLVCGLTAGCQPAVGTGVGPVPRAGGVPVPPPTPPRKEGDPVPPRSDYEPRIDLTFDADVTKKSDKWFEVKTRKGNTYRIVPHKDLVNRSPSRSSTISYSQVKPGQRLRLDLYYDLPAPVGVLLLGAKPAPVLMCHGFVLWGVEINGIALPPTGEKPIDD